MDSVVGGKPMTKQEELEYLFGILSEASKWTPSHDDPRDLVRMEVEERVANLVKGITPEPDENGLIQSTIHPDVPDNPVDEPLTTADYQALEATGLNKHLANKTKSDSRENWKVDKVRCQENGKVVWHPLAECHQEKLFPNNPKAKKFRWVWDGPQDKQAQMNAMWEAHERP